MIGFYNYTLVLTYISLLLSVLGMFLAIDGRTMAALICLLFCGVFDMFDGKVARTKKNRTPEEKRFGIQIDSLCDVVCFGVFPAVLGFALGASKWWQMAVAALFVLCGVIRLAYFNVTEELRQNSTDKKRECYTGLPITSSAILAPLLMSFTPLLGDALPLAYTALLALLGLCYIMPLSIKKPGLWGNLAMMSTGVALAVILSAECL